VSASRGNHSQSLAYAGRAFGVPVTIVVPEGNSPDKNAATEAFGAEICSFGPDVVVESPAELRESVIGRLTGALGPEAARLGPVTPGMPTDEANG